MKQAILLSAVGVVAAAAAATASAEEVGRVISSTPIVQQVPVPHQVCSPGYAPPPPSGGGALVGAIVGGLLGNTIGGGMGKAAATGVGVVAGAAMGNSVEANGQAAASAPQCFTQTAYENRTVAYNVTYEYNGQQYAAQMPNDPGPTVRLQMNPTVADAMPPSDVAPQSGAMQPPSGAPQGVIVGEVPPNGGAAYPPSAAYPPNAYPPAAYPPAAYPAPAYPVAYPAYAYPYYPRPYYYPPVSLSLGFGYSSGWHHH